MASPGFALKIHSPSGQFIINDLEAHSTITNFKSKIEFLTGIPFERIKIYSGFPPKPIINEDRANLCDADIRSGDTLTVRCEESNIQVVPDSDSDVEYLSEHSGDEMSASAPKNEFIPTSDIGIIMREDVPANNSCLFTSVYYILNRCEINLSKSNELRKVVAEKIAADKEKYNSAVLMRSNASYVSWIVDNNSWGGDIELAILSEHFKLEICAIDVKNSKMHRFGEEKHYKCRCFLIYDGIHYDPLYLLCDDGKRTIFSVDDEQLVEQAMEVAKEALSSRQFTDMHNYRLKCNICGVSLKGNAEATAHAKETKHTDFGEI